MCLATVYQTVKDTEEVVQKNVSKIYVEGSKVRLIDIMGMETVVEGSISFVDLAGSVVKLSCPTEEAHQRKAFQFRYQCRLI